MSLSSFLQALSMHPLHVQLQLGLSQLVPTVSTFELSNLSAADDGMEIRYKCTYMNVVKTKTFLGPRRSQSVVGY